jgi:hypothetical protein
MGPHTKREIKHGKQRNLLVDEFTNVVPEQDTAPENPLPAAYEDSQGTDEVHGF